jgi:4-amino-4-deoxy-L-arabinose transferase-like glycosyltransferase
MKIFSKKTLVLLILLGAVIRLAWLNSTPSGFFRDEAAIGYNAYSIWRTGKDEFGMRFPLFFRSFEVFFLPLYLYLEAPIVGLFGLGEFTTRALSAFSGVTALVIIYFIAKRLQNEKAAIFAVLLLAIAPWHIFYSRGAFEGNLAITLFSAGFLFYLIFWKNKRVTYFLLSLIAFVLSVYSYQAERVVVPLFGICAVALSYKFLWKERKKLIIPAFFALVLLIPILSFTFQAAGLHRASGVSLFNKVPEGWSEEYEGNKFVDNRLFLRSRQIVALYLSYYSPRNLFVEGDYDKERSTQDFSVFYAWTMPLLLIGLFNILKSKKTEDKLLLSWILVAPIPAALTGDPFHTYRSLLLYLPLMILMGLGAGKIYVFIKKKAVYLAVLGFLSMISFTFFVYDYAVITQATRARNWDYGYKQIVQFLDSQSFPRVVVDDPWTEPYIDFLFFERTDPRVYQNEVLRLGKPENYYYTNSGKIRPSGYGEFEFRRVDWPKERGDTGTVFVFSADRLPESEFSGDPKVELLKTIYYPDGKVAYRMVRII